MCHNLFPVREQQSTQRKRKVTNSNRKVINSLVFRKTKELVTMRLREVTNSVALFSRHFGLPWPAGAELGKLTFTIVFVYEKYNF